MTTSGGRQQKPSARTKPRTKAGHGFRAGPSTSEYATIARARKARERTWVWVVIESSKNIGDAAITASPASPKGTPSLRPQTYATHGMGTAAKKAKRKFPRPVFSATAHAAWGPTQSMLPI